MPALVTVLLVDDHPVFLAAACRHLQSAGWLDVVGQARNGREAVAQTAALKPHAVLMDLTMPEMGGLQATRLIKAQPDPPRIYIASHLDDPEHRELAARAGADGFVSKLDYVRE